MKPCGTISINSLYEFLCIAFVFPFIVWMGACGVSSEGVTSKVNRFLGDLSYPLYIVHYPLMYIFYRWLIKNQYYSLEQAGGMAVVVVISSIVLASIFFIFL